MGNGDVLKTSEQTGLIQGLAAVEYHKNIVKILNRCDKCLNLGRDYEEK